MTMIRTVALLAAGAALLGLPQGAAAAERVMADVACKETKTKFVFDCQIVLMGKKSRKPIEGARLNIKADMPAMPMAHNVRPVIATAMGKPGHYRARLHLEMYGEWALRMIVSGPARDIVIKKHRFGTVRAGGQDMRNGHGSKDGHGGKTMDHKRN